ncbi:MAG: arginine--tRNA ligase [Bacteroidetes bacterium]|jgi:arginyl-tRNA synthetase|nr:arginine--tRNA ligase [Bacteroidota bacterium]
MTRTPLESLLDQSVRALLTEKGINFGGELPFQRTRKEFQGEVTLVTFPLAKPMGVSPEQAAETLGKALLETNGLIAGYNVVKGFLNIEMSNRYWADQMANMASILDYGKATSKDKPLVMVEYSSPNTNKPLHLGHLRNNFLGWSVAEILAFAGHKTKKVQIINDRGIHICKSMQAWIADGRELSPEDLGMKGDKFVGHFYVEFDKAFKREVADLMAKGISEEKAKEDSPSMVAARDILIKWESEDKDIRALWSKMNSWVYEGFSKTYKRMEVDFDRNYYESETYLIGKEKVLDGLSRGIFYQQEDGSIWVDLETYGMDQKLLLRSDGTAVYMTQDIGTAILRFEDNPSLAYQIYTVGNEQDYHFKVLFIILELLGYSWAKDCYHLSYGMVDLPSGKMKSREGTVVDADDLMEDMVTTAQEKTEELGKLEGMSAEEKSELFELIGLGALKYFLLKVDPKKRMLFDPEESIDLQGNTAPFIQYSHARIKSILKRYEGAKDFDSSKISLEESERQLLVELSYFPVVVDEAATAYSPALVANYIYGLVKGFNQFYQQVPILKDGNGDTVAFRITLIEKVAEVVKNGMGLLGISVPERM